MAVGNSNTRDFTVKGQTDASDANGLANVVPQLLAQALMVLRAKAITPSLVNREYETLAGGLGSVIEVPLPAAQASYEMEPATRARQDVRGFNPGKITIPLDQWQGSDFTLTDKEEMEIVAGTMPRQAAAAMATLATDIDRYILGLYKGIYNAVGIAGVTPFLSAVGAAGSDASQENFDVIGNTKIVTDAARILNDNYAGLDDRRFVMNPAAQANALGIRAFQDVSWSADPEAIRDGQITEKLGFGFFMNQNILRHVAGAAGGVAAGERLSTNGTALVGATSVNVTGLTAGVAASADGTGFVNASFVEGDLITFAGSDQTHVVSTQDGSGITFAPGLAVALTAATVITATATHTVNLAFQRDAITFVNRPLRSNSLTQGQTNVRSVLDPESGLGLRLEVTRQRKQTNYEFDVLFGGQVLRPEHIVRVLG